MKKSTRNTYLFWISLCELTGIFAGLLNRNGINIFLSQAKQPSFMPPGILFPTIWTILYLLMGIGIARVQLYGQHTKRATGQFALQLLFNFAWPLVFFRAKAYGYALVLLIILWVLVLIMALEFEKQDEKAGLLQIPYLLWLGFAAVQNLAVYLLNN